MKLKELPFANVAEIQEAVTDELKKKKKGIFSSFSETVRPHNILYICQCSLFWILKNHITLKIIANTFGPYCVCVSRAEAAEIYGNKRIKFQAENETEMTIYYYSMLSMCSLFDCTFR